MRQALVLWAISGLVRLGASDPGVSRDDAIADAPGLYPGSMHLSCSAQRLDGSDDELLITVNRQGGHPRDRQRVAIYLGDGDGAQRYRLCRRIEAGQPDSAGFAPPEILHPLIDGGPQRVWVVHISERNSGNGGWQDEHLLSLRRPAALDGQSAQAAALDEIDLVPATQAYQPFLAEGEAVLSAASDELSAEPMHFRFSIWGPHDAHVDPRGGTVSGTYRLRADGHRPGCFRLEVASFVRVPAAPGVQR
jgi:hypothetical protein